MTRTLSKYARTGRAFRLAFTTSGALGALAMVFWSCPVIECIDCTPELVFATGTALDDEAAFVFNAICDCDIVVIFNKENDLRKIQDVS